jgi:hypothetical protein
MKQTSFILSLVIPGPSSPDMDINVYLQPLIDELLELWNVGVQTLDASKMENFTMRAQLMWTINDLPAYADFRLAEQRCEGMSLLYAFDTF